VSEPPRAQPGSEGEASKSRSGGAPESLSGAWRAREGVETVADEELLAVAVEAARMAGALLAERARHGAERAVTSKSTPTDLVSEADTESERAIRELLAARRPYDGIVGEEGSDEPGSSGLRWVVDPLDGTVNFLFSIPQWCVSVAVRDERQTIAGAVYDPNRDELFTATRGGRAIVSGAKGTSELTGPASGQPAQGALSGGSGATDGPGVTGGSGAIDGLEATGSSAESGRDWLACAMVATGLAYDADVRAAQGKVLARLAPRARDIRRFGSAALDLTWTAAGRYDAYFERSVKQWDIAAGQLICERAGLRVLELDVFENLPWGILVAPAGLAEALLEVVGGP
jgi:myo-inositol-1(or 4)-monophosphatase